MSLLIHRAPRRFSADEYERLAASGFFGPEERLELIEGEIVPMTAQDPKHANAVAWCNNLFSEQFGKTHLVRVQLPVRLGQFSMPEPDLALLCKEQAARLVGHPTMVDLVLEVANTSLALDRGEKLRLYASAGLPEYWIVNVRDRVLEVYRDPQGDRYMDRFRRKPAEFQELLQLPGPKLSVATLLGEPSA